ncbi:acyltransferase family protein [Hymenobacter cellulosivorans]|uniref:Acyltransferase n=1 Tax=Hymenobacter cellulosivorans TaxID=2932249 RepID=A0ABY4F642_9BACT|nr:acyltransferase [Hymenobacter cellulosivorans]UOQ51374.1 acyltransferase [Hymenobacter cellulosivorans]
MKPAAYFPALTGFRAVAALAVFLFHFPPVAGTGELLPDALHALFREGHVGVSLFFTLSGFLISRRYYHQSFSGAELRTYLYRRWARIYPVFFLVTTATFILDKLYQKEDAVRLFLVNLTLVKGLLTNYAFSGVPQSWSLTTEECFYLLAPALFWLGRRASRRWWPAVVLGLLLIGILLYAPGFLTGQQTFEDAHFVLIVTIFGRSAEFLLGAAFAQAPAGWLRGRATLLGAVWAWLWEPEWLPFSCTREKPASIRPWAWPSTTSCCRWQRACCSTAWLPKRLGCNACSAPGLSSSWAELPTASTCCTWAFCTTFCSGGSPRGGRRPCNTRWCCC